MKIGIIGAMDLEIKKLTTEEMTSAGIVEKAGMKFHVGRLGDTDVVIVKSGVGKVNRHLRSDSGQLLRCHTSDQHRNRRFP